VKPAKSGSHHKNVAIHKTSLGCRAGQGEW
jgi:hypothetical protein